MQYDAAIQREQADKLYHKARFLVSLHALGGFLLGLFLTYSLPAMINHNAEIDPNFQVSGLIAILCAIVGALHGHVKAGELRLEAQRLLCQHPADENIHLAPAAH